VYNCIIIFPTILIYKCVRKIKIGRAKIFLGIFLVLVYLFFAIRWINKKIDNKNDDYIDFISKAF